MGKTRTVTISDEETKKKKKVRLPGLKGGERIVSVEAGPLPKKEKEETKSPVAKATKKRKVKKRSKKYQKAKSKIKVNKFYSPLEAVKLLKEISYSRFNGAVELHLVVKSSPKKGNKKGISVNVNLPYSSAKQKRTLTLKREKKAPLIHTILGKVKQKDKELVENAQAIFEAIGKQQILKAYLKATMSPSIKLDLSAL